MISSINQIDFFGLNNIESGGKVIYVSAGRGSGKSGLIAGVKRLGIKGLLSDERFMRYRFDHIFLIHEAYSKDKEYHKLKLRNNHIIEDCSFEQIDAIYEWCKEAWEEDNNITTLIIFEDCLSKLQSFRKKTNNNILDEMVSNGRGYNISVLISSQMFKSVSTTLRSQIDFLICFDTRGNEEFERLRDAFKPRRIVSNKAWNIVWETVFQDRFDSMIMDVRAGEGHKIYRNFNLVENIEYNGEIIPINL